MSREILFNEEFKQFFETSPSPKPVLLAVEASLRPLLDAELARLIAERDFLREVYEGMTGSADVESASTLAVDVYLQGTLSSLGFD
jgi:hypothetical protein